MPLLDLPLARNTGTCWRCSCGTIYHTSNSSNQGWILLLLYSLQIWKWDQNSGEIWWNCEARSWHSPLDWWPWGSPPLCWSWMPKMRPPLRSVAMFPSTSRRSNVGVVCITHDVYGFSWCRRMQTLHQAASLKHEASNGTLMSCAIQGSEVFLPHSFKMGINSAGFTKKLRCG